MSMNSSRRGFITGAAALGMGAAAAAGLPGCGSGSLLIRRNTAVKAPDKLVFRMGARRIGGQVREHARHHGRGNLRWRRRPARDHDHHRLQRVHRGGQLGQGALRIAGRKGVRRASQEEPEGRSRLGPVRQRRQPQPCLLPLADPCPGRERRPVQGRRLLQADRGEHQGQERVLGGAVPRRPATSSPPSRSQRSSAFPTPTTWANRASTSTPSSLAAATSSPSTAS